MLYILTILLGVEYLSLINCVGHIIKGQIAAHMTHIKKVCIVLDVKSFPMSSLTWKAGT